MGFNKDDSVQGVRKECNFLYLRRFLLYDLMEYSLDNHCLVCLFENMIGHVLDDKNSARQRRTVLQGNRGIFGTKLGFAVEPRPEVRFGDQN